MKRILASLALILALLIPVSSTPVEAGYGGTRTVYVQYFNQGAGMSSYCKATAWFGLYESRTVYPACPRGIQDGNRFMVTIYRYGSPSYYANY